MTMAWQNGRELATLTKDDKTISYSYNAYGIRTEKNNGVITKYFYDSNNNLISLFVAILSSYSIMMLMVRQIFSPFIVVTLLPDITM